MKFGIVGTNFISDIFMAGAKRVLGVEVVAICSRKKENALSFQQKYGLRYCYENLEAMINDRKIDAIYLATPNSLHYEQVMLCLNNKIPVFCEKPLGLNDQEVKQMIECSKKNQTLLFNGIMPLYNKNFKVIKEHLSDVLPLRRVVFNFTKYSSRYDRFLNNEDVSTFKKELGNGSIMDLGVYCISVMVALFGRPKNIEANGIFLKSGVDATFSSIFSYEDFEVIVLVGKTINSFNLNEICGENGAITIKTISLLDEINFYDKVGQKKEINLPLITHEQSFQFEIEEFVKCVQDNKIESDLVDHELSLMISEVMTKARSKIGLKFNNEN